MAVGAIAGVLGGKGIPRLLNRIKLEFEGLYPVITIGLVVLTYGLTQTLGGNGFLAVYLTGVLLGKEKFIHRKSLTLFHDGLAWLMQIAMFLALGLLVFPSKLVPVIGPGLMLSFFLMLIARPVSVFIALSRSRMNVREKLLVSWVGLRGAVPIILATYPLLAGIGKADLIFNLVFFIVLTSALFQGTSIAQVSSWLKLNSPERVPYKSPLEYSPNVDFKNSLAEILVPHGSKAHEKSIVDLQLPKEALILIIQRKDQIIVPRGNTKIESGDILLVLVDNNLQDEVEKILQEPLLN